MLALLALQLALGLTLGRRWCLACLVYFELLQPRWGEGPLEDSRPPRFANMLGLCFLTAASVAYLAGQPRSVPCRRHRCSARVGGGGTGFCAGCSAYRIGHILTGRPFVGCPLPPSVAGERP